MSDLHDYLDDRLSPEEREAFERRLAGDPELTRRLCDAREVREALRSDDAELSPGFYTRTVAQFEAAQPKRTRAPFGLAWSTVGLAAATLAAAAIFVPLVLRDEVPLPEPARSQDAAEAPAAPVEIETEAAPKRVATRDEVGQVAEKKESFADADSSVGDLQANEPVQELNSVETFERSDEPATAELLRKMKEPQAVRPPPRSPALEFDDRAGAFTQGDASWTLPAGGIDMGALRLASGFPADREAEEGARQRAAKAGATRYLLVGRRPGLDSCASLILTETAEFWNVLLQAAESTRGEIDCAVPIPADGRPVRFIGEPVE